MQQNGAKENGKKQYTKTKTFVIDVALWGNLYES